MSTGLDQFTAMLEDIDDFSEGSPAAPVRAESPQGGARPGGRKPRKPSFIAGAPIVGFTGPNGAGKTLIAVTCAINDDLANGRPVFSTVDIRSPWGDSTRLTSMRQLLELRDCTVLIDEIAAIFSSRDSLQIPREFDVFLQTLRHRGVTFRWTAPAWKRADVRVREITQVSVGVRNLGHILKKGQFWPTPITILAGALDATGVGVDETPEKILKRRIFIPQRLSGWGAYETLADTPRIGHGTISTVCVDCGGSVPRPSCDDDRHSTLGLPVPSPGGPARRRR